VLFAGGAIANNLAISSCEMFLAATNTFSAAAPTLTAARVNHTATLLPNGSVMIAGGAGIVNLNAVPLATVETFDPSAGWWAAAGGSLPTPRERHTATLLADGRVLAAGGWDGTAARAEAAMYFPANGTWGVLPNLPAPRHEHTATLLGTGRVLVAGGFGTAPTGESVLFNPANNAWSAAATMAQARHRHTATMLFDGRVLVTGGRGPSGALAACEIYNPLTDRWLATGPLLAARASHTATLLGNGWVLVAGGENGGTLDSAELYDPAAGVWHAAPALGAARMDHAATLLGDGRVLVTGGFNGTAHLADCRIYTLATNSWAAAPAMTTGRSRHRAVALPDGRVLVAGGATGANTMTAQTELYDPAAGAWRSAPALAAATEAHTATLLANGRVLVTGGRTQDGATAAVHYFDRGLYFDAAKRPLVDPPPATLLQGEPLALTGANFRGISEASASMGASSSPANFPVVTLRAIDSGLTQTLPPGANWSATTFTSTPITGFPLGHALVTVHANGIPSAPQIIRLAVPDPTPYELWRMTHFTPAELADPAISGDLADPENDGIENLLEYLQALDPKTPDNHLGPQPGTSLGAATLTFRLNKAATDVTYEVRCSTNLLDWTPDAIIIKTEDMGSYRLLTALDLTGGPRRFMRLEVTKP
jgi:hypothetical protein